MAEEKSSNPSSAIISSQPSMPAVGDSNTLQITQHKLNGNNFREWAQSVLLVFEGKGKTGYLTGTKKKPAENDAGFTTWMAEDAMAKAWLVNSMETRLSRTYLFYKSAKEIWDTVKEMYSDLENTALCFEIRSAIKNTKQGALSVTDYYNRLLELWQEMDQFYELNWVAPEDDLMYKNLLEKECLTFSMALTRNLMK